MFLDDIADITADELYRLAEKIPELQLLVDTTFVDAYNDEDFTSFDAALGDLLLVTNPVAVLIRQALAAAQETADTVAHAYTQSRLVCGYENRELWVACSPDDPLGYITTFEDPATASALGMEWFVGGFLAFRKDLPDSGLRHGYRVAGGRGRQ